MKEVAAASSLEEAEGACAAAKGFASTARVEKSKAAAAATRARKAAAAAAASLRAVEAVAYAGASKARERIVDAVVREQAELVAIEAYADAVAMSKEVDANRHLQHDLGTKPIMEANKTDKNHCSNCGDFTTRHSSLLTTYYLLLTTYYSLLTTHYSLLTTHYSLLTAHCSLLTTHYSLLTAHCSLLTTSILQYFTTSPELRGGLCLHCYNNPAAMEGGKPKAIRAYEETETKKQAALGGVNRVE